jgi:hypothetical protein
VRSCRRRGRVVTRRRGKISCLFGDPSNGARAGFNAADYAPTRFLSNACGEWVGKTMSVDVVLGSKMGTGGRGYAGGALAGWRAAGV